MSDGMEMILELLPWNSSLQKKDNPLHIVLDKTVGEWLDHFEQPYEQLFLLTATGGWLDAHGKDYGVLRKIDETDDSYRQRIIYEKLDHLTPQLLADVYNIRLFNYREDFSATLNTLASDNPYICEEGYIGLSDEETIKILDKKFIVDNVVTWVNENGDIEYIFDTRGKNILANYSEIYGLTSLFKYFVNNNAIEKIKLVLPKVTDTFDMFGKCYNMVRADLYLPNATYCVGIFSECSNLVDIHLDLPKATSCGYLFQSCTSLTSMELTLPNATTCGYMFEYCENLIDVDLNFPNTQACYKIFKGCTLLTNVKLNLPKLTTYDEIFFSLKNVETIDVTIPTNLVSGFKSYVTGLNLQHLTSLKINGEEQL